MVVDVVYGIVFHEHLIECEQLCEETEFLTENVENYVCDWMIVGKSAFFHGKYTGLFHIEGVEKVKNFTNCFRR